jgi:hypothetical protein
MLSGQSMVYKDQKEIRAIKETQDHRDRKDLRVIPEQQDLRGRKVHRELKDPKVIKETQAHKAYKDQRYIRVLFAWRVLMMRTVAVRVKPSSKYPQGLIVQLHQIQDRAVHPASKVISGGVVCAHYNIDKRKRILLFIN